MVTLKNIAEEAGVAVRTVSVVLNGKENRVSTQMAEKIQKIAKRLNYRPNIMARAVRTKKTHQIGVLVSELSNPLTGQVIEVIEGNLLRAGYKLLLGLSSREPEVAKAYLRDFAQGMVDGILNLDPEVDSDTFRQLNITVPYLNFLRPAVDFDVRADFAGGIKLALSHLWELGHRKIGFLSGPKADISSKDRLAGFHSFFQQHSTGQEAPLIEYGAWTFASGLECGHVLMEKGCTAILGANDSMAIGAMKTVQRAGLTVPDDMAIVGFDDSLITLMAEPQVTSVHIPWAEIAHESVESLLSRIDGKSVKKKILIQPKLMIRASTVGKQLGAAS